MLRTAAALLASAWSVVFALVHLYWALGGGIGLPSDLVLAEHPRLFAVDVAAIPLCLAAGLMPALVTAHCVSRRLRLAAWCGVATVAGFALLHSVPPLAELAMELARGAAPALDERERLALLVYEPWWLLGGLAFLALAVMTVRRLRQPKERRPR